MTDSADPSDPAAVGGAGPDHGQAGAPAPKAPFLASGWRRLGLFAALLLGELLIVAFCYQFLVEIECTDFQTPRACLALREGLGRLLALALLTGLAMTARPQLFGFLGAGVCALFATDAWAARRIPAEPHQIQRGQLEKSSDLYTGAARPRSGNPAARTFRA